MADSPEALEAWIARTDDVRERLTNGGYGSQFTADDLFPLFEAFVAKATTATPPRPGAGSARWLRIGVIIVVALIIVAAIVAATTAL